jgi:hypothetical protein
VSQALTVACVADDRWDDEAAAPVVQFRLDNGPALRSDDVHFDREVRALIKRRILFDDLRHTCASHLVEGPWAPKVIREPLRLEEVKARLDREDAAVRAPRA